MTRKNRSPKEFFLMLLNQHLKFLGRVKKTIPENHHFLIDKQENKTNQKIALVNNVFTLDYDKAIKEFKNEQKSFNQQIDRKLKKKIEMKDDKIKELKWKNRILNNEINTQNETINDKDDHIDALEKQISSLRIKYDESVDNNLILSNNLESERTQTEKLRKENEVQKDYIEIKESDLKKLVDERHDLEKKNNELTLFIESCCNEEDENDDNDEKEDEEERQWRQSQMVYFNQMEDEEILINEE
ncbi:5567_t:CDS:2, partial [Cetraspora pellucida]